MGRVITATAREKASLVPVACPMWPVASLDAAALSVFIVHRGNIRLGVLEILLIAPACFLHDKSGHIPQDRLQAALHDIPGCWPSAVDSPHLLMDAFLHMGILSEAQFRALVCHLCMFRPGQYVAHAASVRSEASGGLCKRANLVCTKP